MKKCIGAILMALSLACITTTVIRVAMGWSGIWSVESIGAYIFHPLTMIPALWLLQPQAAQPATDDVREGGA